ncbi:MAG: dimethyl sulfoxide reductase anchor subunit [Xanthomonadaceae bacterium]|nr:dimethyl sulfoxide reductase anchor subunit [Xanthomonadaceae bacterium]MDE2084722.1 dimethyl sulfoxide reductase anchor subunit [Xanthomonadaceae bacterium]MDE2257227.1 dimethyl sulfoxide reductase anchor subunit [Xanthomonadaceae bacterium]
MRPAFSVIFFTVMSGSGYGLLFLFGLLFAFDTPLITRNEALIALAVGAIFVIAGLLASTLHLGQPQRAWRAFSQWRSSWLSREGVASLASFAPMLALAWCLWRGGDPNVARALGALLAVLAAITVVCTAKIYTSLKTIAAWHNAYVLPGYLLLGLLGGAAWLLCLHAPHQAHVLKSAQPDFKLVDLRLEELLVIGFVLFGLASITLKSRYWRHIDTETCTSSIESATGLGRFGAVRSVEAPHTEENYLTHEMGFALARKHAARLRRIALILIGPLPILLALAAFLFELCAPLLASCCMYATAFVVTAGLFVERWLFFAQAKHVVMLYYGGARPHSA